MGRRSFLAGFLIVLSLVGALVFWGRREAGLPAAIPAPEAGIPFLFFEGRGESFAVMGKALAAREKNGAAVRSLDRLLPLLAEADDVAALFASEHEGFSFSGVLRFDEKGTKGGGRQRTSLWEELKPVREDVSGPVPDLFELEGPSPMFPLYFGKFKGLVLAASSPQKIWSMMQILEKGEGGMAVPWEIEKRWPNHFYLYDGGIASRLASKILPGINTAGLSVSGAVRFSGEGGRVKWRAEGVEDLFPGFPADNWEPVSWTGGYIALDPFIASFGINLPPLQASFIEEHGLARLGLNEGPGFRGADFEEILPGPLTFSLTGRGKLLIFPAPGALFQLPDRGEAGEAFAESFWKKEWTSLVPAVEKLNGYPSGGVASIPFSILCAANRRMLRFGVVDGDALKYGEKKTIADAVPLLKEAGRAVFWAYADGPALARALEGLVQIESIAGKLGRGMGIKLKTASRITEELKKTGVLTLILSSPGEGILEWEAKPDPADCE
jgi:hypothetical protein